MGSRMLEGQLSRYSFSVQITDPTLQSADRRCERPAMALTGVKYNGQGGPEQTNGG